MGGLSVRYSLLILSGLFESHGSEWLRLHGRRYPDRSVSRRGRPDSGSSGRNRQAAGARRYGQVQGRPGNGLAQRHSQPRRHEQILERVARRQECTGARLRRSQGHRPPDAGRNLSRGGEIAFSLSDRRPAMGCKLHAKRPAVPRLPRLANILIPGVDKRIERASESARCPRGFGPAVVYRGVI